jgi:hypothetical protein
LSNSHNSKPGILSFFLACIVKMKLREIILLFMVVWPIFCSEESERASHFTTNICRIRMWVVESMKEFESEGKLWKGDCWLTQCLLTGNGLNTVNKLKKIEMASSLWIFIIEIFLLIKFFSKNILHIYLSLWSPKLFIQ